MGQVGHCRGDRGAEGAGAFGGAAGAVAHAGRGQADAKAEPAGTGLEDPQLQVRGVGEAPSGAGLEDPPDQLVAELGAEEPLLRTDPGDHAEGHPGAQRVDTGVGRQGPFEALLVPQAADDRPEPFLPVDARDLGERVLRGPQADEAAGPPGRERHHVVAAVELTERSCPGPSERFDLTGQDGVQPGNGGREVAHRGHPK